VDRLVDPAPTGARFRPRELPDGDAAAFVRRQIAAVPTRYRVEVRIDAPAETVRRVVGRWATVDPDGDAACVMRMNTDYLDWPVAVLAAIGTGFEVVEPADLHERVREVGRRFTRVSRDRG
jgi:predicted DNA-binding transcriptional regulator YafY